MENIVFCDFGIEIILRGSSYSIRYDAGGIVPRLEEVVVSPEQAERARKSSVDAYNVLIEATANR